MVSRVHIGKLGASADSVYQTAAVLNIGTTHSLLTLKKGSKLLLPSGHLFGGTAKVVAKRRHVGQVVHRRQPNTRSPDVNDLKASGNAVADLQGEDSPVTHESRHHRER